LRSATALSSLCATGKH